MFEIRPWNPGEMMADQTSSQDENRGGSSGEEHLRGGRPPAQRYRTMIESAHEGIWEVDAEGRTIFVNARLCEMLGWTRSDMIGRHFQEFMLPEDREKALERFALRLEGRAGVVEHRFRRRDGSILWVNLSTFPRGDDQESVVAMLSDITDLKETQEALERSQLEYLRLVENSPDAIVRLNRDLEHIFVNRRLEELVGIPREEYLGKTNAELGFDPGIVEFWDRELGRVLETGEPNTMRFDFQGPDGVPRHLETRIVPEFDADGEVVTIQATVRDLTDQWKAEERLKKLAANVPGVVYQFVLERDGSVRIPLAVGGDIQLLGLDPGQFEEDAATLFDWIHPGDEIEVRAGIAQSASDLERWHQRFRFQHPERGTRWIEGEAEPERLPDGGTLWHGYLRDVTESQAEQEERRRLEARLRGQQKLESLGVLAGGIAHEFNNILMTIMGDAELAVEDLSAITPDGDPSDAPETDPAIRSAIDSLLRIGTAARQAAGLTRQMLHYAGEAALDLKPTDLRHLLGEMAHLLRTSISDHVSLQIERPDDLPPVRADSAQLRQVVLNLVLNASEAIGHRGGEIEVGLEAVYCDHDTLRRTELDDQLEPGRYVRLRVTDDGEGMDAETRSRIFEPFYTTRFAGRGLGLASTLGILRGHGGGVAVHSAPGEGTTFALYLPALDEQSDESSGGS